MGSMDSIDDSMEVITHDSDDRQRMGSCRRLWWNSSGNSWILHKGSRVSQISYMEINDDLPEGSSPSCALFE